MAQPELLSNLPVEGYIRVSRVGDRSGESYISPDVQAAAITKLAAEKGLRLRLNEPEENESGGTMDRPIFNQVMKRIREGESGGVIVYTLDRFARSLVGGYSLLTELAGRGAIFASATEAQFDFATSSGRLMLQIHLMMAEYFRERTKESWAESVDRAVGRGIHPAPYGAFGYDRVDSRLVPNGDAPIAAEAFRLRGEERMSYPAIAAWLNDGGHPNYIVDGEGAVLTRPWTGPSVRRMMSRRVYLGEAFYGVEQNTEGRDAIVNSEAHEAIVPERLWLAAQGVTHSWSTKRREGTPEALLHGIVRCAGCRYLMSAGRSGGVRCYGCRKQHVSGKCTAPSRVALDRLEEYVEKMACGEFDRRRGRGRGLADAGELTRAQAKLDAAREDLEGMRQDTAARKRLGTRWLQWLEPYLTAVEDAEAEVLEVSTRLRSNIAAMTSDLYRSLSREERRLVLAGTIDAVFLRPAAAGAPRGRHTPPLGEDRVLILWRGQGPTDLPVKSRFAPEGVRPFAWPNGPVVEHEAQPDVAALEGTA